MQLTEVVGEVLGIDAGRVDDTAHPGGLENWDSLRHLQIIVRLEEVYRVSFSHGELRRLTSVGAIRAVLHGKGVLN
ncbi:acyl carrier protein [Streptomyces sp. NPDC001985]|uniref:acyl carrier protein n=1 Tax=Streptomyces sp. NPDC001985 TaxID=3154406 RepID=UPI003330E83E